MPFIADNNQSTPMLEITRERTFPAPPERVWAVIEPVARLPEWFAGISFAELISGAGVGRKQRLAGQFGKDRFELEQTVFIYEPPRRLAWRHDRELLGGRPAPPMSVRVEFYIELEPVAAGTRVRLVSRQWPGSFLKKIILRAIAPRRIGGMMEVALGKLGALLMKSPTDA